MMSMPIQCFQLYLTNIFLVLKWSLIKFYPVTIVILILEIRVVNLFRIKSDIEVMHCYPNECAEVLNRIRSICRAYVEVMEHFSWVYLYNYRSQGHFKGVIGETRKYLLSRNKRKAWDVLTLRGHEFFV